ncbi:helix-turn-helix transcriptional regulator [Amycolatopsis acidicola]|uniref:helix-turn-helix transcriptional regulator n=1 Tax=Amycolatopsis acidicola TaxID=2596893 RepID=UPI0024428980|nr:WYL domain-containing protein [Amycolatopsis acidicola]
MVEELRASAPRALTVAALAARFEMSKRTVQRDLQALLKAGVPVRAAAAARELSARIVALPSSSSSPVRDAVELALATDTALRLSYLDAAGHESDRVVEPAGLLTAAGRWYLIAWCRTRQAGRGFRLDRITAAAATTDRIQPRDLAELLRGSAAERAVRPGTLSQDLTSST